MLLRKSLLLVLIVFCVTASACAPGGSTPPSGLPAASNTPRASATAGATGTATHLPETATITPTGTMQPLPAVPTFTPTLDARAIITAKPGPKAQCSAGNKQLKFVVPTTYADQSTFDYQNKILDFLHQGGDIKEVYKQLSSTYSSDYVSFQDITNDGVPELILALDGGYIIGCNPSDASYALLYQVHVFDSGDGYALYGIRDMNRDGIPEVIFEEGDRGTAFFITEWDGTKFRDLIQNTLDNNTPFEWAPTYRMTDSEIIDLDHNGTLELLWKGGVDWPWSDYAHVKSYYREETHVYGWNGKYFVSWPVSYSRPIYRFQAIQDGDQAAAMGKNGDAFSFYQTAIFSDQLDSWSPDREQQLQERLDIMPIMPGTATPTEFPEDISEYPRLAAYAYFRMATLHLDLGETSAAQIQYNSLQSKFPASNPGHPYAEMAAAFWNAYQASQSMYDGCAAAIEYAAEHPDILTVLGSDYHGNQSRRYEPADICPFR